MEGNMTIYQYCIVIALLFLIITLYYIKQRKIEFGYSIVWFSISVFLFIIAAKPILLEHIANFFGIAYGPSFLFMGGTLFNMLVIFYLTIKLSSTKVKIVRLTQEIGIMKSRIDREERNDLHTNITKY
jgi:hypothetical protein